MMWEYGVTERKTPGRDWTWWRFKQSIKMWGSPRNNTCTSVYLHPLKISEVKFIYPGQHLHIPSVPLLFLGGTENGNGKIRLDKTRAVRLRKRTKYTFRGTTTVLSAFSEIAQIWLKGSHQQGSTELSLNNTLWFSLPLVQFFLFFFFLCTRAQI